MKSFTVFCQDVDGGGTIWISHVEAEDANAAADAGALECATDWGRYVYDDEKEAETADPDVDSIHVLGVAEGNVNILMWEDIEN